MSRTALKIFKPKSIFNTTDLILLFAFLSFAIGYIIGVVLINNNSPSVIELANHTFSNIIESKEQLGFISLLFKSMTDIIPYILLSYIFGTTMFGCAIIPILCVLKGVFSGVLIAYIYNTYAINGLGFVALIIAPVCIFSSFILILASRESLLYSHKLFKNAFQSATVSNSISLSFKLYSIRYLIILLFSLICALFDATLTSIFFNFFSFS